MLRLKIIALFSILLLAGVVLSRPKLVATHAHGDDLIKQISGYKAWKRINDKPYAVTHKSSAGEKPDMIWFDISGFG